MSEHFEEFQFPNAYTGQCFENNFLLSDNDFTDLNHTPIGIGNPGPFRMPKRRGRPVANNAARERSRVKTLRSAFLELQRTLPAVPPDTKLSKLDVLVLATTYIAHLMSALQEDGDVSQIFAANGCMHPVKKWPMRTRLYAGILSSTVPALQEPEQEFRSPETRNSAPWTLNSCR
ncbi:transcription factor 24-like [Ruditapes philippinarum]|uniref:transcription factor 24-like n=1 Tax=Ruditapes philippinarum TaxID=129788 RepID=UPI00295B8C6E|nr:transcription factor 24-like [Ruditapes philippinarum]